MQKAIVIERKSMNGYCNELNGYLSKGWVVDSLTPFHPSVSVSASGNSYGEAKKATDHGSILVIIDDLGIADAPEE
jgi:hypothetical protein